LKRPGYRLLLRDVAHSALVGQLGIAAHLLGYVFPRSVMRSAGHRVALGHKTVLRSRSQELRGKPDGGNDVSLPEISKPISELITVETRLELRPLTRPRLDFLFSRFV
jgi:hypothetical protein